MPTVGVGRGPYNVAVDTRTDTVYVADFFSAAVSVVNGSACRAGVTHGCHHAALLQAAGSHPVGVGVDDRTGSVYVTQLFQGSLGIFRAARR
jgi:DNA-binding beta-propeller fold protein YncE